MLTNKEYKTMLEAGVDAGFLAIVESAFKVMFEAGAKTVMNAMRPLSLENIVNLLNIDILDCTGPEGKVNWNAVSRKLYEDNRFIAVDMKVNAIVRRALDISGIKYVDEAGNSVYAYPGLEKNTEIQNIEENLKNGLKQALVSRFSTVGNPQKFINLVNRISVEGAARALANSYLEPIRNEIEYSHEFQIGAHDVDDDEPENAYLDGEVPQSDGRMYGDDNEIVMENEDGTKWTYDEESADYSLRRGYAELLILSMANDRISSMYIYEHDDVELPNDQTIVHDIVNLYTHLAKENLINGVDFGQGIDYRKREAARNLTSQQVYQYFAKNLNIKDIVRLIKCEDGVASTIFKNGVVPGFTLTEADITGLQFFTECVDAGLLDADDLAEWAEHIDEPDWIMSNVDPRMLMFAKQNDLTLFSRRKNSAEAITRLFKHLLAYSDEVIPALTGKNPSKPVKDFNTDVLPDNLVADRGEMQNILPMSFTSSINMNVLKNPRAQVKIINIMSHGLENLDNFWGFLTELYNVNLYYGYVPLSSEAIDYVLMNSEAEQRHDNASAILRYYKMLLETVNNKNHFDTRTKKMLFDEINRNVDERIRSVAESFNDMVELLYLAKNVPGFEMPERYTDIDDRTLSETRRYRGAVSANHFIRILGRQEHQRIPKDEQLETFMELCLAENIRKEYESRTPAGKRIRTFFMTYAAEEPHLSEGEKGTPRDADKLLPFTFAHMGQFFGANSGELSKFFGTYLNGKDADVSRLYAVKSNQLSFGEATTNMFAGLLNTFDRVFNEDEMLAVTAFFGQKGGILSCTSTEFVEIPGATGKKGNRRPVQKDEIRVRLAIAAGLAESVMFNDDSFDKKAYMYVVNECLAGRHLILAPEAEANDLLGKLLFLSGYYDAYRNTDEDGAAENAKNIVDIADLDSLITSNPGKLLKYVRSMPQRMATKLCQQYFTEENVRNMSRTKEGLKLFLDIADLGQMGDAEWENFAKAFAAGNANNIKNLIKTLPAEEGERLMSKLERYINAANHTTNSKLTAVGGTEVNAQLGSTVQFSMANGLRWMKGYVTAGHPAAMSEDGKAGLYSKEDALTMFGAVSNGWRLPTSDEILHLGDNPDTISEESLGFTSTGMADGDGELISGSEDFCFAWCMSKNGPVGYSVDSNNVIELEDSNIEPEFKLAIKLVR